MQRSFPLSKRRLPLDAIDSRTVFVIYAVIVGAAGVFIALWGSLWIGGPLNGQPWGVNSITRMAGMVIVAAACCAFGFSRIADPADRRRGLGWFIVAHVPPLLMATAQFFSMQGDVRPRMMSLTFFGIWGAWMWLYAGWTRYGGDLPPIHVVTSLFGGRPHNPTPLPRAEYEEQMREAGAQDERNRLARDLHDSIKQQIFAIQTAAATVEARFQSDPAGARQAIAQVRNSARESMAEMDAMLDQLRVTVVENTGLIEALKKQCEALAFRTGATVTFTPGPLPPSEALPPGAHRALLRVAQEALSNVARHARAAHVSVTLAAADQCVQLRVEDDGAGYDAKAAPRGIGLDNMRARVTEYNGATEITGVPGKGTAVAVSIPYTVDEPQYFLRKAMWLAAVVLFVFGALMFDSSRRNHYLLVLMVPVVVDVVRYAIAWRRARKLRVGAA